MVGFSRVSRVRVSRVRVRVRIRVSVRIRVRVRLSFSGANLNRKTLGGELLPERRINEPCALSLLVSFTFRPQKT